MRLYLKYALVAIVVIDISSAIAGSYEDFFTALKRDEPAVVGSLLERGFDANSPSPEGLDGLYLALRDGSLKAAAVLAGWPRANVDTRTPRDETPLMIACLKGHLEIARMLVARGADVNKTGWTPLHYASSGGHVALIQMLVDENAYIDAESPNGTTPLMMAAMYGSPEAVKVLLDAGADPAVKNQLGLAAADFASQAGRHELAKSLAAAAQAFNRRYRGPARDLS